MLQFSGSGTASSATISIFSGDGQTSVLSVDLAAAPMNVPFNGNFPVNSVSQVSAVIEGQTDNSFSVSIGFKRSIATFTFNKPIPVLSVGDFVSVNVSSLLYNGV